MTLNPGSSVSFKVGTRTMISVGVLDLTNPSHVPDTFANIDEIIALTDYFPKYTIENGIKCFVHWYKDHFKCP